MQEYNFFDTALTYLKGVGEKRAALLKKELLLSTYGDLLFYFPFRHVDKGNFQPIASIIDDSSYILIKGKITSIETVGSGSANRMIARFCDASGCIELVWFKGIKWIREKIRINEEYIVFGKPSSFNGKINFLHPEIDPASEEQNLTETLLPFYSTTEKLKNSGITSKILARITKNLTLQAEGSIPETLPDYILEKFRLIGREQALISIHHPADHAILQKAQTRLKFEELFFMQLEYLFNKQYRNEKVQGFVFGKVGDYFNRLFAQLPFQLTGAQQRVMKEIRQNLRTGHQMNRLLQGDVGSGKTLVALMSMVLAIDNGFQACMMVPTEILAVQHYNSVSKLVEGLGITVELLTGSTKASKWREIDAALQAGSLHILIGTHSLIEERVQFKNLGLVIIDEQHRFGVEQRSKLWSKNDIAPHILVMTATPIPRTLSMTVYGNLDYSIIDELPPGRKPVQTIHFNDSSRLRVFGFMRKQIEAGRQVYIIYPLIKESETLDLKDLMDGYESIVREFPLPDYAISIVHGQMKSADKDYEMNRFKKGETQIMVATTVIEVGVDVPNASVMIIENAERFGLSQLHQLRGRVGRGSEQSFCILMTGNKLTHEARKRIDIMVKTNDGFEIAEEDLKIRGPGDLQGTRQSGILDLKIADIVKDEQMIRVARDLVNSILNNDANLDNPQNIRLKRYLQIQSKKRRDFGSIS